MKRKKGKRGSTLIALFVMVAALAAGPGVGSAAAAGFFQPVASWADAE